MSKVRKFVKGLGKAFTPKKKAPARKKAPKNTKEVTRSNTATKAEATAEVDTEAKVARAARLKKGSKQMDKLTGIKKMRYEFDGLKPSAKRAEVDKGTKSLYYRVFKENLAKPNRKAVMAEGKALLDKEERLKKIKAIAEKMKSKKSTVKRAEGGKIQQTKGWGKARKRT